ncbi:MAG: PIG-L family deacetylase, partial [Methylothermaceae bacterium]|nr:PIG-L family deacetylase [Methylothermaceae bacterium]
MLLEQDLIPFQVSSLPPGPWLVCAPHPDDETFGMGGALLLAKENRIPVTLVVLTDGRLGGGDDAALVEARECEARAAAERLGIQTIDFWCEPDRDLRPTPALVAKIGELLKQAAPTTVFFPSPMEYHPDHRATAQAVWEAAGRAGFQGELWAYEISTEGRVDRLIDITAVAEEKRDLMAVYRSQLAENDYPDKIMGLNRARTYSLPAQVRYAEGFYDFTPHRGRPF